MPKVNVFITVDTEHSIGGAFERSDLRPVGSEKRIFGKFGGRSFGIPLMMDIADSHGIRMTFFVEVLNKYFFGERETREVCDYILARGHDVQLHLHPNYLNFTLMDPRRIEFSDLIGEYPLARQIELLEEARDLLGQYGISHPIAFRAGCFGAGESTIEALNKTGFLIDSSYNRTYLDSPCLMPDMNINDATRLDGVFEFPITNFMEAPGTRFARTKPLDINGVSFEEIRQVLCHARSAGPGNVIVLMHSFSFIKPRDVQYSKIAVRRRVIGRFSRLCRFLEENSSVFRTLTFDMLGHEQLQEMADSANHEFPGMPLRLSAQRLLEQFHDNLL